MLREILSVLSAQFTVRHIMVPKADLCCAPDAATACQKLEEHPEYNLIPIVERNHLAAFVERGNPIRRDIDWRQHVIASDTDLLTVTEILDQRCFCFVLSNAELNGYVHFSDLNHRLVKMIYYVIIEALESAIVEQIRPHINPAGLQEALGEHRAKQLINMHSNLQRYEADRSWSSVLFLGDVLRCGRHFARLEITDDEIKTVKAVRNRMAHATDLIVSRPSDIRQLVQTRDICLRVDQQLGARTTATRL